MPPNPQTDLFNVIGGAPQLPICDSDMASFTRELQAWIVKNFSQLYAAMAAKEFQSQDICVQLGMLAPDDCLIEPADIDQTCFTYAETADEVLVPGSCVLPFLPDLPSQFYSAGAQIQSTDDNVMTSITPLPDSIGVGFAVLLSPGNEISALLNSPNEERINSGDTDKIGIQSHNYEDGGSSVWAYYLAIPFA